MNSPYMGDFKVTQEYKGSEHDGLDLVGLDSKEIHSTVNGIVKAASNTDPKGFGINVKILKDGTNDYYIYAHMSEAKVKVGQRVKITDVIGIEGSTGKSTGSHCHYCVRTGNRKGNHKDISAISGIPNKLGVYNDGYVGAYKGEVKPVQQKPTETTKSGVTMLKRGSWNVRNAPSMGASISRVVKGEQSVTYVDIVSESNPQKYGERKFYKLRDGKYISVNACEGSNK